MKLNEAKCHSMRVTWHQHHKYFLAVHYTIELWKMFSSQKNLGITITDNMDWGKHISESSSKATKVFDFFRRNLAFAPWSTKEVAYKTLVHSKLEYAAPFWSPYSILHINQIRKFRVQRPTGPADGEKRVVSAKCLMNLNGHLLRPVG